MVGGFRELRAWQGGVELAVLVFDLTEAGDELREAALEVPQRIAAGAMEGRPRSWQRCLALALGSLDRLEAEAKRRRVLQDLRLTELVAKVRGELESLQDAARPGAAATPKGELEASIEVALEQAA